MNLKPERVFHYFRELSDIPRESHNEKAVSDYIYNFGKKLGLETKQDDILNVYMRKPATNFLTSKWSAPRPISSSGVNPIEISPCGKLFDVIF